MKRILFFIGLLFLSGLTFNVSAAEYSLPSTTARLIGENSHYYVVSNDGPPLEAISSEFQIGLLGMLEANPGTDPYLPKAGKTLIIPSQMLLPATKRDGIIVNLAELRLYYFPKGSNKVMVYPIGIGQLGANTPKMVTTVSQLIKNPTWTPTPNIRKRYAADGVILPAVFPAGSDNPMGLYALRLSYGKGQYLIHGTNANFGIGLRVSSGCIRLRPEDIQALFYSIPVGTGVQVINEPIKYSKEPDGSYYIEVHQPLSKRESDDPQTMPLVYSNEFKAFLQQPGIDQRLVAQAVARRSGMPVRVNKS
ncbi:L,D-transpeptidase family protein [Arsenophonus sp. PmNCSU2021_1]|uniref:L,D-transpeptidase family protein n=1 Tax=Arsenophonus sp. PmNCSU2021_1 TaxID=3118989 RepID=UPI002FF1F892